jgi:hypothetical protein
MRRKRFDQHVEPFTAATASSLLELREPMPRANDRSSGKSMFSAEFSGKFCG